MKKLRKINFKAWLIFKTMCLLYCSIDAVQQQRDIPEESVPYASPLDCQRVYEVVQDGVPDPNLFAVVHKYPRQAPVEPAPLETHQAFDEMPASSAADSTQHYAVINGPVYDELNRQF